MKTISIEIPEGKEAKWINNVLTLVDEQPVKFKFKVGDKVTHKNTGNKPYTITATRAENGKAYYYFTDEDGVPHCNYPETELEPYVEPQNITERIKTFEDAYEWCDKNGYRSLTTEYYAVNNTISAFKTPTKDLLAYLKLRIITCALNEGFGSPSEDKKWCVYYNTDTKRLYTDPENITICTQRSCELVFKSDMLAKYAATQFKSIYMDFCFKGEE